MRKNKSMLTKTVFYGLGISLVIGSLVVPLGMDMLNQNVANNTLVHTNASVNEGTKTNKNFSVDADLKEQPFIFSSTVANENLDSFFSVNEIDKSLVLTLRNKTGLVNYLKSKGKNTLDLGELRNKFDVIPAECFNEVDSLKEVIIPNWVTKIRSRAFIFCKDLTKVIIPESVTEIGFGVFEECKKLTSDGVISNSPVLFDWWVNNHQYNGQTMSQMSNIVLSQFRNSDGKDFNVIGDNAFAKCTALKNITISQPVTKIRLNAFSECINLENVTIPSSVTWIGFKGFYGCSKLKNVIFQGEDRPFVLEGGPVFYPSVGVKFYFEDQKLLNTLCRELGKDKCWLSDGYFVFNASNVLVGLTEAGKEKETLIIPNSVKTIGKSAFAQNEKLRDVIIPASVKTIGPRAFANCSNLRSVTFQKRLKKHIDLEDGSFSGDNNAYYYFEDFEDKFLLGILSQEGSLKSAGIDKSKLRLNDGDFVFDFSEVLVGLTKSGKQKETLTIPNSVESIGKSVFEKNEKLTDITIPASVKKIDGNAFLSCSNLRSVTFQGNNPNLTLGDNIFPESVEHFYFENKELLDRLLKNFKKTGIAENKCIVTVGKWFVVDGNSTLTSLTDEGKQQKELKIPSFVTEISDGVFQGSQALTITFANSVTIIGNNAFSDCSKLENVNFDPTQSQLKEIGGNAFSGCLKLANIILPPSLTTIGAGAFKGCTSLTSIAIPGLVSGIGARAFDNCNHLESVTFLGQNREFSMGKEVFPQNINQFYFIDKDLFDSLKLKTSAGIISRKCVLVEKYFEIKDDNSLIAITSDAQELSELRIPGFVKAVGNGINVVFGESAKFQKVIIPTSVDKIKANAFNGCSLLKEVIINSTDITIESNAFVNMPNTQYYVPANADVKEQLKQNGIKESQIHFLNLSATSIDYATIGIIVGAVVFSIIALGLGIGIPIRKQHRINVLNAKIITKRVDKLASATALSFKKLLEVSEKTNEKIDKLETQNRLIAAKLTRPVDRVSKPDRPTNPKPPIKKPTK